MIEQDLNWMRKRMIDTGVKSSDLNDIEHFTELVAKYTYQTQMTEEKARFKAFFEVFGA